MDLKKRIFNETDLVRSRHLSASRDVTQLTTLFNMTCILFNFPTTSSTSSFFVVRFLDTKVAAGKLANNISTIF